MANTPVPPLDLNNVQGDILQGFSKKHESFYFFKINTTNVASFRTQLASFLPLVTSVTQARKILKSIKGAKREAASTGKEPELVEMSAINIAFSQKGLDVLNIQGDIGDAPFKSGMKNNVEDTLGDDLSDWDPKFKDDTHGVILIAANSESVLEKALNKVKALFHVGDEQAGIFEVTHLAGRLRPGKEKGHEHFGFNDGLSQPAIKDVDTNPVPGQETVAQGIVLLGREGDNGVPLSLTDLTGPGITRPSWALDGSFLAFRYLKQLVPEFNLFLEDHALPVPTPIIEGDPTGAELLGARLVGRWKSGAAVEMTPLRDDPALAVQEANQDFAFTPNTIQVRCPFAAHVRKTNPRSDLAPGATDIRRILRRGIPFGPEVTDEEKKANKSSDNEKLERGLLFACYQSNISNGFEFLQESWANNSKFPPKEVDPGFDPIIGVGNPRQLVGTNPNDASAPLELRSKWVIPRGGEYFFSPSISALKSTFAAGAASATSEL